MVVEKAAGRPCTRAFPDRGAAKPGGSNTATEIMIIIVVLASFSLFNKALSSLVN